MITSGFIFLAIGVIELLIVQALIYPSLRWRYEKAKVTGSQGKDPARIMSFVKLQCLVAMPLIGFAMGNYFQKMAG
jgi:hypothetical protein